MSGIECAFLGTLGRDAEAKISKTGKPYLRLSVRVGEDDTAQWVSVMCFDQSAAADKLLKGARVYCEGRLSLNEWTNAEGVVKAGLSVLSWHCRLAEIGRNKPAKSYQQRSYRKPSKPIKPSGEPFFDDPIHF